MDMKVAQPGPGASRLPGAVVHHLHRTECAVSPCHDKNVCRMPPARSLDDRLGDAIAHHQLGRPPALDVRDRRLEYGDTQFGNRNLPVPLEVADHVVADPGVKGEERHLPKVLRQLLEQHFLLLPRDRPRRALIAGERQHRDQGSREQPRFARSLVAPCSRCQIQNAADGGDAQVDRLMRRAALRSGFDKGLQRPGVNLFQNQISDEGHDSLQVVRIGLDGREVPVLLDEAACGLVEGHLRLRAVDSTLSQGLQLARQPGFCVFKRVKAFVKPYAVDVLVDGPAPVLPLVDPACFLSHRFNP